MDLKKQVIEDIKVNASKEITKAGIWIDFYGVYNKDLDEEKDKQEIMQNEIKINASKKAIKFNEYMLKFLKDYE